MKTRTIFLLTGIISLSLFFVSCGEYKTNTLSDGTLEIIAYNGKETELVIPADIKGIPVTVIGYKSTNSASIGAFQGRQLTSVTIPDSVTQISYYAFRNNQLTSVVIPDSVTSIGAEAFRDNQLISVTIPDSITKIESSTFANNQLTSIDIPNSVTDIGDRAFSNNQLASVVIPNSITKINSNVFENNQLTNLVIPNSVTYISNNAFAKNQLTSVTIPNSVTSISDNAFAENQLTRAVIPNSVTSIGKSAFYKNKLTSVVIPNSVRSIGDNAFRDNQLSRIAIPGSEVRIYGNSFDKDILINGAAFESFRNIKFYGSGIGEGSSGFNITMNYKTGTVSLRDACVMYIDNGGISYSNHFLLPLELRYNPTERKGTLVIFQIQDLNNRRYESIEVETKNGKYRFHRNDSITFEIKEGNSNNTMNITLGNGQTYSLEERIIINRK
jgi:hypothetical protein